ncbi:DAG protein, chloroplastic [Morella rubra]|uniref:DAG protein, chloroplastic n=1 Tax=Morella rubra TaxID=262757 RepID=A0A6A1VN26_9ROSI|nr:DAG protein, chloroplastic [Morella rubra]
MEVLSFTPIIKVPVIIPSKAHKTSLQNPSISVGFSSSQNRKNRLYLSSSTPCISCICFSATTNNATSTSSTYTLTSTSLSVSSTPTDNRHWTVLMEAPPQGVNSKPEVIDYYVKTLERVLGSEKDAQMSIYGASCQTHFGFCCDIDEQISRELARLPGVLSVKPDPDYVSVEKTSSDSSIESRDLSSSQIGTSLLFPARNTKHWLVRMDKPGVGVVTKAQMVDYYAQALTKVLGNKKDAQMCIYHVSWLSNFGFCCTVDDECARELAGMPGVLSVLPDKNFDSENKDYGAGFLWRVKFYVILAWLLLEPADVILEFVSEHGLKGREMSVIDNYLAKLEELNALDRRPISLPWEDAIGKMVTKDEGKEPIPWTSEGNLQSSTDQSDSSEASQTAPIKTKKLFITVKIIMDKISKRSKGYAFIEYTTEEAASAALKEMNGKIINGWMIVVDVARSNPPRYSRGRPR